MKLIDNSIESNETLIVISLVSTGTVLTSTPLSTQIRFVFVRGRSQMTSWS